MSTFCVNRTADSSTCSTQAITALSPITASGIPAASGAAVDHNSRSQTVSTARSMRSKVSKPSYSGIACSGSGGSLQTLRAYSRTARRQIGHERRHAG